MNVACPSCGERGKLPKQLIGLRIKCKKCATSFVVTDPGAQAPIDPELDDPFATDGGIAVAGLDNSSWTAPAVATLSAEPAQAPEPDAAASLFVASPLEEHARTATLKQYKILTPKDKWFENKFDLPRLEDALNHFAKQGWVVRSMITPHLATFSGGTREELVILLEREIASAS